MESYIPKIWDKRFYEKYVKDGIATIFIDYGKLFALRDEDPEEVMG